MLGTIILLSALAVFALAVLLRSATWTNDGLDYIAQTVLNKISPQNFTARLFTNSPTISAASVNADFTECALSGYSSVALAPSDWTGSTTGGLATYSHPEITFTFSAYAGGTTINGYYCTIPGLKAVIADNLSPVYVVPAGGGSVKITPTYNDRKF